MSMGQRKSERQQELWIAAPDIPAPPGHPYYERLKALLAEEGFDGFVEGLCEKSYAEKKGRPSIPPWLRQMAGFHAERAPPAASASR